jgi:hypothetical protein
VAVWFVVEDRWVWLSTPISSKKVARLRNNRRCGFLGESGECWAEREAVHLMCTATIVEGDKAAWVALRRRSSTRRIAQ